jgi:hypothetical protein
MSQNLTSQNGLPPRGIYLPRHVVKVMLDGAAEMAYNEPEHCFQHPVDSWHHEVSNRKFSPSRIPTTS